MPMSHEVVRNLLLLRRKWGKIFRPFVRRIHGQFFLNSIKLLGMVIYLTEKLLVKIHLSVHNILGAALNFIVDSPYIFANQSKTQELNTGEKRNTYNNCG